MVEANNYVPRVNQIDAIHLDKEITRIIRERLLENLQAIFPTTFSKVQPELDLLIQVAIWFGSVGKQCSTFGQQLLVLAYDPEKLKLSRLYLHFALTILPGYIKKVDERHSSVRSQWLHTIIEWCDNVVLVLSVVNFFRFLKTGRMPSMVDWVLGVDYITLRHNQRRDIGYKYLTRELLWGGFMEILGLVLPIINFRKMQRSIKDLLFGQPSSSAMKDQVKFELTKLTTCTFCGERPTLPYHMNCNHIYCYYCLSANIATDSNFACTNCGAHTQDIKPV